MVADSIEREITIAAPRERVWEVLTRAESLSTWFGAGTPARIEQSDPPTVLALRRPPGAAGEEATGGGSTLVTVTLTTEPGDHTRLRVAESGFASPTSPREAARSRFEQNRTDWTRRLTEFACHTERLILTPRR
ncbi:hypothetical protein [Kitasatospora sp. NPDC057500]|uniref:hypothetical protein n=1 Tax=Kitasatospora sp. NPDC057500 TaxID=3346151 RepID=UPI0036AE0CF3